MKKIHEKLVRVFESRVLVGILYGIGIVTVIILIFSAGFSVGFRKASFGHAWGENYERNFGMRPERPPLLGENNFPNAHGSIGKIIKVELPTIIVQDKDNTEKVILIKDDTKIQRMQKRIEAASLNVDNFIVTIGSPNDRGQIEAKFIRVMPAPDFLDKN
jgi:hypothetical protein